MPRSAGKDCTRLSPLTPPAFLFKVSSKTNVELQAGMPNSVTATRGILHRRRRVKFTSVSSETKMRKDWLFPPSCHAVRV